MTLRDVIPDVIRDHKPVCRRFKASTGVHRAIPDHVRDDTCKGVYPRMIVPAPVSVNSSINTACGTLPSRMTTASTPFSMA